MKTSKLTFTKNVQVNTITLNVWRELENTHSDEFDRRLAIVQACTGLGEQTLLEMKAPDYNTLANDCVELVTTAGHTLQQQTLNGNETTYTLKTPVVNAIGQTIKEVNLSMPTVKHSKLLAALTSDDEREQFMYASVTGLNSDDIARLSTNDYLSLDTLVGNFFHKGADFFLASNT